MNKISYEGYSQLLCKEGHYWTEECEIDWDGGDNSCICPECGKPAIWENDVDITNGSHDDEGNRIDNFIKLKVKSEKSGICSECGKKHVCERLYEIPKKIQGENNE